MTLDIRTVRVGARVIAYLEHGQGPAFVCLHGFPDTPASFVHQFEALGRAGYRVIAPYLRGYPPSALEGPYQAAALGADVIALLDALGIETASIYGHDWGTSAAYAAALLAPKRISRLVAGAVPYGPGMPQALLMNPAQQRRSWYLFFFQTRLAEIAVPLSNFAFVERLWADWSPGFTPPREVLLEVTRCLSEAGALEAALGYYRTAFDPTLRDPELDALERRFGVDAIDVPTLYVHGERDGCIGVEVTEGMESMFTGGFRRVVIPGAGHFVHLEAPEAFHAAVLELLGAGAR